jgi:hypothetical protein
MTERFTLLSELGRGGMGVVWKARDEETGQIVALKLLHAAFAVDADYVTRFERELELAKRIHSAHVVEVLGYGARGGTPYLSLEYVDGPSLRELLASHGPYEWPEAKDLLVQITQGLADAHAAGVVHRDLKPSNVLIDPDGVAKLADFGIAKGLDLTRVTGTSTLLGTPAYLAPEGPLDERSDLYSLGIVAYEMLTGGPPFTGSTYQEVIVRHIREAPDLGKLPPEARDMVGWLLEKDPAARPQRASALLPVLYGATAPKRPALEAVPQADARTAPPTVPVPSTAPQRQPNWLAQAPASPTAGGKQAQQPEAPGAPGALGALGAPWRASSRRGYAGVFSILLGASAGLFASLNVDPPPGAVLNPTGVAIVAALLAVILLVLPMTARWVTWLLASGSIAAGAFILLSFALLILSLNGEYHPVGHALTVRDYFPPLIGIFGGVAVVEGALVSGIFLRSSKATHSARGSAEVQTR